MPATGTVAISTEAAVQIAWSEDLDRVIDLGPASGDAVVGRPGRDRGYETGRLARTQHHRRTPNAASEGITPGSP